VVEKIKKITSSTLLPMSSIAIIATAIGWLMSAHADVKHNIDDIAALKVDNKDVHHKLDDIIQRLSRIEGKIENQ